MPRGVVAVRGRLAPVPASYVALDATSKKLVQAMRGYRRVFTGSNLWANPMFFDDLLVFSNCWLICVARPKETWTSLHVVAGPLLFGPGEGCMSKVIFVVWVVGGAASQTKEGSDTLQNWQ